jgi:hypothetical protein
MKLKDYLTKLNERLRKDMPFKENQEISPQEQRLLRRMTPLDLLGDDSFRRLGEASYDRRTLETGRSGDEEDDD